MTAVSPALISALVGVPSLAIAYASYRIASSAGVRQSAEARMRADVVAIGTARDVYESVIASVRQELADTRQELADTRQELAQLRAEVASLEHRLRDAGSKGA